MNIDQRAFRDALGCFVTGVTIVTSLDAEGRLLGITANSFSSVSLDPPLVLFSLARKAYSFDAFRSSRHFAVNVLASDQSELSDTFAKALADKWAGVAFDVWDTDCPIITGALAQFECRTVSTHDGGDHVVFIGAVERMALDPDKEPLVYYRGRYRELGAEPVAAAPERTGAAP
ncbi:MAG: flavin reductase family protein [Geminicoccaceae bacterium]|nr:flavin reductase family protein [Geminicoccaceae bacterium]